MKNQYFGDRRDFFKYELILDLHAAFPGSSLVILPMLTPDDGSREGRLTGYAPGKRRQQVYDFLRGCLANGRRDIRQLRSLFGALGVSYLPFRDSVHFEHHSRDEYFRALPTEHLDSSIVFLDPDIGLETGSKGYMTRKGFDKYLLYSDLHLLRPRMTASSLLVLYQHLQNNKNRVGADIRARTFKLQDTLATPYIAHVTDSDIALFVAAFSEISWRRLRAAIVTHATTHGLGSSETAG